VNRTSILYQLDQIAQHQPGGHDPLFETLAAIVKDYNEVGKIIVISTSKLGGDCANPNRPHPVKQLDGSDWISPDGFIAKVSTGDDEPRTQYGNEPGFWVCHVCHFNFGFSLLRFPPGQVLQRHIG